jgi:hypothetical protein
MAVGGQRAVAEVALIAIRSLPAVCLLASIHLFRRGKKDPSDGQTS